MKFPCFAILQPLIRTFWTQIGRRLKTNEKNTHKWFFHKLITLLNDKRDYNFHIFIRSSSYEAVRILRYRYLINHLILPLDWSIYYFPLNQGIITTWIYSLWSSVGFLKGLVKLWFSHRCFVLFWFWKKTTVTSLYCNTYSHNWFKHSENIAIFLWSRLN